MASSLILDKLTAYVNDNEQTLFTKAALDFRAIGIKGIGGMRIEPDVPTTKNIHKILQEVYVQPEAEGDFVSSGKTIYDVVPISTTRLMMNIDIYVNKLKDYFTQLSLKAGYNETLPTEMLQIYEKNLVDQAHEKFQYMAFSNTAASTYAPSGLIYQASGNTSVTKVDFKATSGTTFTEWTYGLGKIRSSVHEYAQRQPDFACFCSLNQFNNYILSAIVDKNPIVNQVIANNDGLSSIKVQGTNMWLVPQPGFSDSYFLASPWSNLGYAYDNTDQIMPRLKSWYSDDKRLFRTSLTHSLGFFIVEPEYCALAR